MPIVLHHVPPSGPCRAVVMTAQNLGIELDKKYLDLFSGDNLRPEFIKINPQHCVPTIDDDGFYLWESRAIMTYLVNKYAPDSSLYPKDPKERAIVDRMLYFDIGTLYKTQMEYLAPFLFLGGTADPEKNEIYKKSLELLSGFLSKTAYAAGNHLTLADYSIVGSLTFAVEAGGYDLSAYPKITAYLQKLKAEIPNYEEINEAPLRQLKEFLESGHYKAILEDRKNKTPA